ncbi:hypothetical protein ACOSP7_021305 [Xanthoceras sorbifolium]
MDRRSIVVEIWDFIEVFNQSIPNPTNLPSPPFQERNHTQLKLSFSKFGREDPVEWIYKAEQYFEFKNINPTHHVQLASFHLEGITLQWHRRITKFRGPLTWKEFTKALLTHFDSIEYDKPSEALTRLKQTSTVVAYQEAFKKLSHRVDGLSEEFLVGCFVASLKDEICLDIKVKNPSTLFEAIGVA